jgi:hypothetical protein
MKIPLNSAIKNKSWYIIEGMYEFELDPEKFSYKIKPISFEKIDEGVFDQSKEAKKLLEIGDLYILKAQIENLWNKTFDPFPLEASLVLKDSHNKEFTPIYDDTIDQIARYKLADYINEYLKEKDLAFLTNIDKCSGFPPNIAIKGAIIFLLPKNYKGNYYLSAAKEGTLFEGGKIYKEQAEYESIEVNGWIYALINPSMPQNLLKIGMTNRSPENRVKELSSKTAVPTPFQIIFQKQVGNCEYVEKLIHKKLDKYRYKQNREFFKVSSDKLIPYLEKICSNFPPKEIPAPEEIEKQRRIEEIESEIKRLWDELVSLKGSKY